MATYNLKLVEIKEPRVLIEVTYPVDPVTGVAPTELVWVGNLPLQGTSAAFVAAAKTYITNMLAARAADEAAQNAIKASAAVAALVGRSENITV